jgi:hypothetical protein
VAGGVAGDWTGPAASSRRTWETLGDWKVDDP